MALHKDKDGRLVEDKTARVQIGSGSADPLGSGDDRNRTVVASSNGMVEPDSASTSEFDARTRLAGTPEAGTSSATPAAPTDTGTIRPGSPIINNPPSGRPATGAGRTVLFGTGQEAAPAKKAMAEDPVVGWLVVEQGPGRGHSVQLGVGMNSVGRGADQRVCLNFGDVTISSSKQFFVSYDPRSRRFAVHRGDGANLTYLNGAPVHGSEVLESQARIEVGSTTLRFVALCGPDFSWAE